MVKITLITATRNSARDLEELLRNVHDVVDEIIVIDSYSTDNTVEIAKSFNAKVYLAKPLGYVEPYRAYALEKASYDWILILDVDERLNKKLREDLRNVVEKFNSKYDAFSILRVNVSDVGKVLTTFYPHREIRLFKKSKALLKGVIFEQPKINGMIMELPEDYAIIHFLKQKAWLVSAKKLMKYALLDVQQHYETQYLRKPIGKTLHIFSPLTIPLLYLYYLILLAKSEKLINADTMISVMVDLALYRGIVMFLQRIRSKRKKIVAKIIEERGLLYFLSQLELHELS